MAQMSLTPFPGEGRENISQTFLKLCFLKGIFWCLIHNLTHLDTEYDPPVLSIICGFLMAIYTWIHLLQCIVVVRSFLRMLKLCKLAVRKLYLSKGGHTWSQGVLDHGLNLHWNIPLMSRKVLFRQFLFTTF